MAKGTCIEDRQPSIRSELELEWMPHECFSSSSSSSLSLFHNDDHTELLPWLMQSVFSVIVVDNLQLPGSASPFSLSTHFLLSCCQITAYAFLCNNIIFFIIYIYAVYIPTLGTDRLYRHGLLFGVGYQILFQSRSSAIAKNDAQPRRGTICHHYGLCRIHGCGQF